jgi:hypothetical protein
MAWVALDDAAPDPISELERLVGATAGVDRLGPPSEQLVVENRRASELPVCNSRWTTALREVRFLISRF